MMSAEVVCFIVCCNNLTHVSMGNSVNTDQTATATGR